MKKTLCTALLLLGWAGLAHASDQLPLLSGAQDPSQYVQRENNLRQAINANFLLRDGSDPIVPDTLNNMVGGSSVGLSVGILQTPTLTGQGVDGSVLAYGKLSLNAFSPADPACQNYSEACSHITAIGYGAANDLTTDDHITAVGSWACAGLTSATAGTNSVSNSCFGIDTMRFVAGGTGNVMVGEHAGTYGDMQDGTGLVNHATFVGNAAGYHVGGIGNIAVGFHAMDGDDTTHVTGNFNTAVGDSALTSLKGTAAQNTAIGASAGVTLTTGIQNTFLGMYAGQHATTAVNNVLVGFQAGNGLTTGNNATIVGYQAGQGLTTAGGNAAFFGYQAGQNVTGSSDTAVGYNALLGSVGTPSTGNFNTAVGTSALTVIEGAAQNNTVVGGDAASALTSGSFNTIMGHSAGNKITTGSQNVIIGEKVASTTLQTGSGNILIGVGNNIDTPVAGTTNTLNIGGVITATAIGTPSSSVMTMPGNVIVSGTLKNLWAAASNTVSFAAGGTGTINDNSGAGGSINANLVAAAAGLHACFAVATAQPLVVNANGTDVIYLGASPTVAGGNLSSSTVGSTVCLAAVEAGVWYALSHEGTWAVN